MLEKNIVEQHKKSYQAAIERHGASLKSMHWHSYKGAARRYKQLLKDINLENLSILDIGCGTGNLLPYIISSCDNFIYQGIDIMPDFIAQAKSQYPDFNFDVADFWSADYQERADVVITCGTLNFAILDIKKRQSMIKKLFDQSNVVTVFNMSGQHPLPQPLSNQGLIGYVDALEILHYCLSLTKNVVFRHHYHSYDFTIVLFHQQME